MARIAGVVYFFEFVAGVLSGVFIPGIVTGDAATLATNIQKVVRLLDAQLEDVGRTGMIFVGFGVDHVHAKLFPMHGTALMKEWRPLKTNLDKYFEHYQGYVSSHDYRRADDQVLAALAKRIRA